MELTPIYHLVCLDGEEVKNSWVMLLNLVNFKGEEHLDDEDTTDKDIGLLRLEESIQFSKYKGTIGKSLKWVLHSLDDSQCDFH